MSDRPHSQKQDTRLGRTLFWLALLIALTGVGAWLNLSLRRVQSAYPGVPPDVPHLSGTLLAADKSYGVNADLTRYPPEALDHTLARMNDLGLRWVRQPFPWAEIEPAPGQFDWDRWDRVVEATSARGLKLIAVLDTTPAWARPPDANPFTPPTELADFGRFARALAGRYHDRLDYYQIWDEPNLSAHWGGQFVDPTAYAHLLREGAANVRAADAKATILLAALAPTVETGPLNLNEPDFLAGLYAANAAPWFDVVAAQPYGFDAGPADAAAQESLNFSRTELLHRVMAVHGGGDAPVWITAFGWSALPTDWAGRPSPWPSLPPDRQGAYTRQALDQARANWPWLGPMIFAAWDANALPPDDPRRGLALVAGETLLPPAEALRSHVPANAVATVGTYPAHHPSGHYTGDWRFSPAGADVPRRPPATLTIPFEGTRLDLTVHRGNFRGFLYVTVDGEPANELPRQDERAYVVLYDPLEQVDTVTLARYLPDGPHTAVIEAEGGWYQWPIVGWRISREGDTRKLRLGLALVGGLAVVAAGGLVHSVRRLLLRHPSAGAHLLRRGTKLHARYLALGTPVHLAILAGAALAFYFAPGTLLSLGTLGLLFLAILPRPDLGLALVAFSLPFFLLPKSLIGRTISMTEVGLVLVALACIVRRTSQRVGESASRRIGKSANRQISDPQSPISNDVVRWLDWGAWGLTGMALLAGLLTVIPAANRGLLAAADWPTLTLMLLPPAGVLSAIAATNLPTYRTTNLLDLAVVALVGLAFVSTLAAENFGVSMQEFHVVVWDSAAFYAFVRLISGTQNRRAKQDRQENDLQSPIPLSGLQLVDAFLLGTTLMALYAIYQFFFTDQAITAEGVHRALGVYGSPNNLALLLDRAAPVLIAVAAFSRPRGLSGKKGPTNGQIHRRQVIYGLALIPTLVAMVLTFSRGALLLGLPAAILFIGGMRGGRALWAALGTLLAGGIGLLPLLGTERFRSMLDTSAGTGFFRLRLWQSAWAMLRDHPWLGVGLDNFLYQYRTRYILPDAWQEPNLSHPHNILLDFGTRLGVGGVAVLLWLQFAFWRVAWRLYRRLPEGETRALTLGLMGSMIATLAHGLVDNSFFLVDLAFIFFLTLGIVGRLESG